MNLQKMGLSTLAAAATVATAVVAAAPAEAARFTYGFSGGPANPYVFTPGAGPLQSVTANRGNVVQGINGLGVWQGGLDSLQVDGLGIDEILNFNFNQTVRIISARFRGVGFNDDFRLLVNGVSALDADIPGANLLDTGTGTFAFAPSIAQGTTLGFTVVGTNDGYFLSDIEVEVIPTPALLPGLIGMGLAALRKRKGEAAQPEETQA